MVRESTIQELQKALDHLYALTDSTTTRCVYSAKTKATIQPYVDTWITPRIERVLEDLTMAREVVRDA